MTLPEPGSTDRTRVHRHSERSVHSREEMYAVLDEGMIAHVSFIVGGEPVVLPMAYARDGDRLLLHGSSRNRMLDELGAGAQCCAVVTLLDGLVLADTAFNHSVNYRSVVVYGRGREIGDEPAKAHALDLLVEGLLPGRGAELPAHTSKELAATSVIAVPLDEASLKVRIGGPKPPMPSDRPPPWMGVIPLTLARGEPEPIV